MTDKAAVLESQEYKTVKEILSNQFAKRSGLSYFQHIEEGLSVLHAIGASVDTQKAYIIHPLVQGDTELRKALLHLNVSGFSPVAIALAVEYRNVANEGTRRRVQSTGVIRLSAIPEVNQMLIADKVQNRKDFELYRDFEPHHPSDPEYSEYQELARYFRQWLDALGISEQRYQELIGGMNYVIKS